MYENNKINYFPLKIREVRLDIPVTVLALPVAEIGWTSVNNPTGIAVTVENKLMFASNILLLEHPYLRKI